MTERGLEIKIEDKNLAIAGILILIGIAGPLFVNVDNFRIYNLLYESLEKNDQGLLMLGAIRLVLLNGIRGLPHYLGAFIIAESIEIKIAGKRQVHLKGLIALIIIPLVYGAIYLLHGIKYDLGVPAFIVIFAIIYIEKKDYRKISFLKKSTVIILLLLGAQWLDIIPQLSIFKFGRGETSQDIKAIASLIGGIEILTISASMFFILFTFNALIFTKLIGDENKILVANERNSRIERELYEARMNALQARNYIEFKHLVHDLKTPLTSMQALISVVRLMETDPKKQEYLLRIEKSIDNLSEMISEMLYEDKKNKVTTEELFNYTFSQISHLDLASNLNYNNRAKSSYIKVNKVRFSRAIINALDNSYNALDGGEGEITIDVDLEDGQVVMKISDNGIGIREEFLEQVTKLGYSKSKSTGLGLSFIEDVVEGHGGEMKLESEYRLGTSLKIILAGVDVND